MPRRGPGPYARVTSTLERLLESSCVVLDEDLATVRALRPELIGHDSFAPWGAFAARLLRRPAVASIPSLLVDAAVDARYGRPGAGEEGLTREWCAAFRARSAAALLRRGLSAPPAPPQLLQSYGDLNLVYTSRLFQPAAASYDARRFRFVGPCFDFRPRAPPFPWERLDGRPLVLISLGTVYADRPLFFERCMAELAGGDWQVVLAAGSASLARRLSPAPANFVVRAAVPQIELLGRCALFLTHGGMNSVQEALAHDLPLLIAPQAADQFWISARAAELGAALVLDAAPRPGAIRAGVTRLLGDRRYAEAAAGIGASLREAGGSGRAADEVQRFLAGTRARAASAGPDPS
jgi:MGT family glycosyltransferase